MANEWTLVYETEVPIPFTCADGTGIEKGTACELTDPMTCEASEADDYFAGVASTEKIANDGNTTIGLYRGGIFKGTMSGAGVTAGQTLALSGGNQLKAATASNVGADIVGIALETADAGETFLFEVRPGANNNAYS